MTMLATVVVPSSDAAIRAKEFERARVFLALALREDEVTATALRRIGYRVEIVSPFAPFR